MASKSRIELHHDRIIQHIQLLPPKRTETMLEGVTDVTVIIFDDVGKEKKSWLFSNGGEPSGTVMATGLWIGHSEKIVQFLRGKGIKFTRRNSK